MFGDGRVYLWLSSGLAMIDATSGVVLQFIPFDEFSSDELHSTSLGARAQERLVGVEVAVGVRVFEGDDEVDAWRHREGVAAGTHPHEVIDDLEIVGALRLE